MLGPYGSCTISPGLAHPSRHSNSCQTQWISAAQKALSWETNSPYSSIQSQLKSFQICLYMHGCEFNSHLSSMLAAAKIQWQYLFCSWQWPLKPPAALVYNRSPINICSVKGLSFRFISGEGNGYYPLQYSCLGNLMDRGTWRATVPEVKKSLTRLSN